MLVMISLSSGGIWACWISLFRFSSVMPERTKPPVTMPTNTHHTLRRKAKRLGGTVTLFLLQTGEINLLIASTSP